MTPYFPSLHHFFTLIAGGSIPSGNETRRAIISSNAGTRLLSIPIHGGASRLKAPRQEDNAEVIQVSEHGRWRHAHLQAITSEYGRLPYFEHLYPLLEEALDSSITSLNDINTGIFRAMQRIGCPQGIIPVPQHAEKEAVQALEAQFHALYLNKAISALPAIMLLGPRTTFLCSSSLI